MHTLFISYFMQQHLFFLFFVSLPSSLSPLFFLKRNNFYSDSSSVPMATANSNGNSTSGFILYYRGQKLFYLFFFTFLHNFFIFFSVVSKVNLWRIVKRRLLDEMERKNHSFCVIDFFFYSC